MEYKNIIIYGGSSEIASELINEYINKCNKIYIFCRSEINLSKINKINDDNKNKIHIEKIDLLDFNENLKKIKGFENNISGIFWIAGTTGNADEEYKNIDEAKKNLEINFINPTLLINEISKKVIKNSNSFIAVFTSVAGLRGRKKQLFYSSGRAGLITYLSGLRQKLFNDKILVITVIPGYMNTKPFRNTNIKSPSFLITEPHKVSNVLIKGIKKRKEIIYVNFYWRIIMAIIKIIPEKVFKRFSF